MKQSVIELRGISKTYSGSVRALDLVDLQVQEGSRFILLGPNGAGKSTLVRILSTLSRPDQGIRKICGLDPERELPQVMRLIGVAGQENDLDPEGRVEQMLVFQGALFGMDREVRKERARELIEEFGLTEHRKKRAKELSGGNKRRLHCALAMVHRPKLLFLDEPTVGMDPEIRSRFWETLRRINREEGITLFLTTQYLEEADRHGDELALLLEGKMCYRGTVEEFKEITGPFKEDEAVAAATLEESYLRYLESSSKELMRERHGVTVKGGIVCC